MKWQADKAWADKFIPAIEDILSLHAGSFVNVKIASDEMDQQQATDLIISVDSGDIAVRIRRKTHYRDWTIRSKRDTGRKTELEKLKEGFARWYLYIWTNDKSIVDWVLIDLDKVREDGILDKPWTEKPNGDGTWFIVIPINQIESYVVSRYAEITNHTAKELLYYIKYGRLLKFPSNINLMELCHFLQLTPGETSQFWEG